MSAKPAQNTSKKSKDSTPKGNADDAGYILKKFLSGKPNYGREFPIAYKLLKKFPERAFWESFPLRAQVPSLLIIWEVKSRAKLSRMHLDFLNKQKMNESVLMVETEEHVMLKEKVGDDKVFPCKKKKSIIEFCQ